MTKSFLDAIRAAQKNKASVPESKTQQVQQAKVRSQVTTTKPSKRSTGRGR